MDIKKRISRKFQSQTFDIDNNIEDIILLKTIALGYSITENAIAVVSDLKNNNSYIYYGGLAKLLELAEVHSHETINSIWEDKIYKSIHKDDLSQKHINELRFYNFIKSIPTHRRKDFYIKEPLRMFDKKGNCIPVIHRMHYFYDNNNNIMFSLCLYNLNTDQNKEYPRICNSISFQSYIINEENDKSILTDREIEILKLIEKGKRSIDISEILSISKNTVSRHRQNILEKLQVRNSIEACQTAKEMNLI